MSAQKLERLLNLTALLLDASSPIPAEDIHRQIPGYPEERTAFRRAFERDKEELRSLGVPTQLVIYPGQYHGITKPTYQRDRLQRYLAWYDRYLKPAALGATAR